MNSPIMLTYPDIPLADNIRSSYLKEKKEAWAACAAALARVVFEHPGGPYRRIPRIGDIPSLENSVEYLIGHSTACWSFFCQ